MQPDDCIHKHLIFFNFISKKVYFTAHSVENSGYSVIQILRKIISEEFRRMKSAVFANFLGSEIC